VYKAHMKPFNVERKGDKWMLRKITLMLLVLALGLIVVAGAASAEGETGVDTANGWYEGEEIYYLALGREEGVSERGENQIYLIGGDRLHQAQVVLHIPGEPGYSPHWNVNAVHTVGDYTVGDIIEAGFGSEHYPEALFDDVEDILGAEAAGLVKIVQPGVVVLCPIVSEEAAEAPGNNELPIEDPFGEDSLDEGF
jgi:hypothetical protein